MRYLCGVCLALLAVMLVGCDPAPTIEATSSDVIAEQDAITPEAITDPAFAVDLSEDIELTMTQVTHEFEVNAAADGTDLIFRDAASDVVLAINLPGINSIEVGDYATGDDGTAGAALVYDVEGERFTSRGVSGPVTIIAGDDSISGTFALTFTEAESERSVFASGTFDKLTASRDDGDAMTATTTPVSP